MAILPQHRRSLDLVFKALPYGGAFLLHLSELKI